MLVPPTHNPAPRQKWWSSGVSWVLSTAPGRRGGKWTSSDRFWCSHPGTPVVNCWSEGNLSRSGNWKYPNTEKNLHKLKKNYIRRILKWSSLDRTRKIVFSIINVTAFLTIRNYAYLWERRKLHWAADLKHTIHINRHSALPKRTTGRYMWHRYRMLGNYHEQRL